ncbi:MAG: R3H domain-containing nucleic acid-binding protein [Candidatus Staskawiczbacteria bacterium]|nr:R3H domain-containing nucleic acid-binding protein [Candidatus Staskawiczbacteria bacterium]
MLNKRQINKIKETAEEFFKKITTPVFSIEADLSSKENVNEATEEKDVVDLNIKIEEPQILIGQGGQTLFEIQRLLRMVLNKKMESIFYLNLDINDYKKKKIEYLKSYARDLADKVALVKNEKSLPPMSAYERRVIHAELSQRADVATESQGTGPDRYIVIKPK